MLGFYNIDERYIKYLQGFDAKVPNIGYAAHNKFVCGVVLKINNLDYYVPLSSNQKMFKTSFAIKDGNNIVATLRFSFMFPAPLNVLSIMNFKQIEQEDRRYGKFLEKEWRYCISKEQQILNKAKRVYSMGSNPNHQFYKVCCDFLKLEEAAKEYIQRYNK